MACTEFELGFSPFMQVTWRHCAVLWVPPSPNSDEWHAQSQEDIHNFDYMMQGFHHNFYSNLT